MEIKKRILQRQKNWIARWRDKAGHTMIQYGKLQARRLKGRSYRSLSTNSAWITVLLIMINIWRLNFLRLLVWPTSLARSTTGKWISNEKVWSKCEGIWLTNLRNFCRRVISLERRLFTQRNISMILCFKKVIIMKLSNTWPPCKVSRNCPQYNNKRHHLRKQLHSKRAVLAQMWSLAVPEAQLILGRTIPSQRWED